MNSYNQAIEIIPDPAPHTGHGNSAAFYQSIAEWPKKNPEKEILSLQVIDTENRAGRAIILYRTEEKAGK
jgi:hypothetical protein